MFLLFSLYFNVFLPDNYKNINIHVKYDNGGYIECTKEAIKDIEYSSNVNKNPYFYCYDNPKTFSFNNVTCSNIIVNNDTQTNNDGRLIYVYKTNIEMKYCKFNRVKFYFNLIHGRAENNNNNNFKFEMSFCSVINCSQIGPFTTLINSEYSTTVIQNNTVYFEPSSNLSIRAFLVHICTGCTFTGNEIVNAKNDWSIKNKKDGHVEDSSCFLTYNNVDNSRPLVFSDCLFKNCSGINPSTVNLQNVTRSFTARNLTFENLQNSLGREGYIFFITAVDQFDSLTLQDCVFKNIECDSKAGGGIGLLFRRDVDLALNFIDCVFENIVHTNTTVGGGVICIDESHSNYRTNINVKGCKFENITNISEGTAKSGKGGAIYFDSQNYKITIEGSSFKNTSASESHAIYIASIPTSDTYTIKSCTFTDCGQGEDQYCITLDATQFELLYSTINFSDPRQSCRCISLDNCKHQIYIGNTFQNIKCPSNHPVINRISDPFEKIVIENNTFDHIEGNFDGRCIDVNLDSSKVIFTNNTFSNCPPGGSFAKITFTNEILNYTIKDSKFIRNVHNSTSPPWIVIEHSKKDTLFPITFENCLFEGNYSPDKGGAVYYGINDMTFIFIGCTFINNSAGENGGALFIQNCNIIQITKCTFCGNKGDAGSGCIFIDNEISDKIQTNVEISECTFNRNEGPNNNVISFGSIEYSLQLSIFDCSFTDCSVAEYVIDIPDNIILMRFESITIEFEEKNGCGGIKILQSSNKPINIEYVNFKSTAVLPALWLKSTVVDRKINIEYCVFESCKSDSFSCFNFDIFASSFSFKNNVIKNVNCTSDQSYVGRIYNQIDPDKLILENISFIENRCSSLFGGGAGLKLEKIENIDFINCKFIGNEARQNKTTSRPSTQDIQYYNGDGGGIQLGYICWMNDIEKLTFNECVFERNKASRHGGAIAIQPIVNVEITNCKFTENEANYNFDSSSELLENHFHKKKEGRGGAIYINTNYNYDKLEPDCPSDQEKTLENIVISECTFTKNNGFDGYAMYVEGDSITTNFAFTNNDFIDNYNPDNHNNDENIIYGAVITTEVDNITKESLEGNKFSYNKTDIRVNELLLVDHYGKTHSLIFSKSNDFSFSKFFTNSGKFTESNDFSETGKFSLTGKFTKTNYFSESEKFSLSNKFMQSNDFSESGKFSHSNMFTESKDFSETGKFSETQSFSQSLKFSKTDGFSNSNIFSSTGIFSSSGKFSTTQQFTRSDKFSGTEHFSNTQKFSASKAFSKSGSFTQSSKFSLSATFSQSGTFTSSVTFTLPPTFVESGKDESFSVPDSYSYSEEPEYSRKPSECEIYLNDKYVEINECEYNGKEDEKTLVKVVTTEFKDYKTNRDGGAIHLTNCGIITNGTKYIDCVSENGGGGAIYIKNSKCFGYDLQFLNSLFLRCKAEYGGAVFARSNCENYGVIFRKCQFYDNVAYAKKSVSSEYKYLYSGSAIFVVSQGVDIKNCSFKKNSDVAVKIYNAFKGQKSSLLGNDQNIFSISGCDFEQEDKDKSSIYYIDERSMNKLEVRNCNFKGKLSEGAQYINGFLGEKQNVHVESCSFEEDSKDAMKFDHVAKQKEFLKYEIKQEVRSNQMMNILIILSATILTTTFLVLALKFSTYSNSNDNNEIIEL